VLCVGVGAARCTRKHSPAGNVTADPGSPHYRVSVTLLVLDTNALRRGHFNLRLLTGWVEAAGEGAQIYIPEVVLWEWAEHAALAHATLESQLNEFRAVSSNLFKAPELSKSLPAEELVEAIRKQLPKAVSVWAPPPHAWEQAIRDQVLQVNGAERKNGIKTGAADSIVLSCIRTQVDERQIAQPVVLATNDKQLGDTCEKSFGDEVLIAGSTVALLEKLNAFQPAEDELTEATEESLRDLIEDPESRLFESLRWFESGYQIHLGSRATRSAESGLPTRLTATLGYNPDPIELHDLRVAGGTAPSGTHVGLADVRIFAAVHIHQAELREDAAGSTEWITVYDSTITHGFIDITISLTWDRHWKLDNTTLAEPAVIVFDTSEYDDDEGVPPFHKPTPAT
jgi:hypothetical protein